ncbi:MAG: hypothetical protein DMG86_07760 [Acidobacteria bacterium]|nr:MAG: hypothetical protein DMG86_07760 [Acidobacteriota bacterium]
MTFAPPFGMFARMQLVFILTRTALPCWVNQPAGSFTKWTQSSDWEKAAVKRLFVDSSQETLRSYSPLFVARPEQPPMLLIQGTKDELYSGCMEYARKLKEVGAPFKLIVLEGAPHGMENWEGHTEWEFYKHRLVEWLRATLKANNSSE